MEKESETTTILLSGGLDSSVLLHYLVKELGCKSVFALSFHYGQRHQRELEAAASQVTLLGDSVKEHLTMDFSIFQKLTGNISSLMNSGPRVPELAQLSAEELKQPSTYVQNRNMILLSLAAAFAESRDCGVVYYGAQSQDEYSYWDCNQDFLQRINAVLALNRGQRVQIKAPFIQSRKSELVRLGRDLGVDFSSTWSCYKGGERPCQVCPTCIERQKAFKDAGVPDPLDGEDNSS